MKKAQSSRRKAHNLTKTYVEKSLEKTTTALGSVGVVNENEGRELLDMIQRYISDAQHFLEKGNLVAAFGAIEYAHGLLDTGVYAGYFKILRNPELFVFREKKVK